MMFSPKVLCLICLTALAVDAGSNDNLVAVIQMFRHGQRLPNSFYTNDPYTDTTLYWGGINTGQLTNEGKRQHFALGQFTRTRYADWLPTSYNNSDFYAQTTDVDRTHMSAQSNIYGLYPATGTQIWRSGVNWQPVPIHPADSDILSAFPSTSCTAYYTERARLLANDTDLLAIDATYADVYSYLSTYTGDNITTFTDTHTVFDDLKIETDVGFALPSWASAVYPSPLTDLAGYYFQSYSYNTLLKRLGTGTLLNAWVSYFDEMVADATSNPKFQMYSAHDFNIASVLNSFGQYDPPFPPAFASSIYLELRYNAFGTYYVNSFSKNGDTLEQFSILGCLLDCPLATVKTLLADILLDVDTKNTECVA